MSRKWLRDPKTVAPLRAIIRTEHGTVKLDLTPQRSINAPTIIHTLECGHVAEPLIRLGCRLPYPPKRRRCKECVRAGNG